VKAGLSSSAGGLAHPFSALVLELPENTPTKASANPPIKNRLLPMMVDKTDAVTLVLEFPGNRKASPAAFLALIFVAGWAKSRAPQIHARRLQLIKYLPRLLVIDPA